MRNKSKLLAFILLVALSFASMAIEITTPSGKKLSLESREEDGTAWVCLDALAKALGATAGRDPLSRYPSLVLGSHRVLFSTATAMTSVDGKLIDTKHPARDKNGCVWIPREFLAAGLPLLLNGAVSLSGEGVAPPAPAPPRAAGQASENGGIGLDVAVASDVVRLTLEGAMTTAAQVRKEGSAIVVQLPRGRVSAQGRDLGSGIAARLDVGNDGRMLRIELGEGFKSFETLDLRNPERLVILLKGGGQVTPSVPPEPPAAQGGEAEPQAGRPSKAANQFLVVIDPGHGGGDTGAIGKGGLQEKDVALAISQKLAAVLEKSGVTTLLTRSTDIYVPLAQRTAIANYNRADVFISIHLNASPASSAKGSETYFMSREATDLWSRQVAEKENAAPPGIEGGSTLTMVLWNLAQTQYIVESQALAASIQGRLNQLLGTQERGVRQAPFVVLEGAQMPAVLVEVAFLSNPGEASQINDPAFQDQVTEQIAKSILEFKAQNGSQTPPNPS
ncbi:MAG: N-acetylmuramoyl-L-alanine amidase [Acidobacteria bacterium]|nr:N-acetylmuramoyl-L-alanine amidase [Acidobacteriota bacterium]